MYIWLKEMPVKLGWYWFVMTPSQKPSIRYMSLIDIQSFAMHGTKFGEWAGPIEIPIRINEDKVGGSEEYGENKTDRVDKAS